MFLFTLSEKKYNLFISSVLRLKYLEDNPQPQKSILFH